MTNPLHVRSWLWWIWCILLISMTGCGRQSLPPGMLVRKPPPISGTVQLSVLEQANPQQFFLNRVNQAIQNARRPIALKEANVVSGPSGGKRALPVLRVPPLRSRRIAAVQQEKLAALQSEILENLEARLQRADEQRLATVRAQLDATVQQSYLSRVDTIDDQTEIRVNRIAGEDSDRSVNLLTKIKALSVDTTPPPTAPTGYWDNRLKLRQEEFIALENRRRALIAQIHESRDQSHRELQKELNANADASYALALETSKMRRAEIVSSARVRLDRQTADILVSSKALDTEADALSFRARQTAGESTIEGNGIPGPVARTSAGRPDLAALLEERTRLQEQIARQTLLTISDVSRLRNVIVVGYQREPGVPDITEQMVRWVRMDRWG